MLFLDKWKGVLQFVLLIVIPNLFYCLEGVLNRDLFGSQKNGVLKKLHSDYIVGNFWEFPQN